MLWLHLKRVLVFGLIGLIGATAWILLSPKVYEARLAIQIGDTKQQQSDPAKPADVAKIIDKAEAQQTVTEIDILRQEGVFEQALDRVGRKNSDPNLVNDWKTYYKMYNVLGGPTSADQNPMNISGLAVVQARAYNPQVAIDLANSIGDVYTETRQKNLIDANNTALTYLEGQIAYYGQDLKKLDDDYQRTKEQTDVADLQATTHNRLDSLQILQNRYDSVSSDMMGAELELRSLQASLSKLPKKVTGSESTSFNTNIDYFKQQLSLAKADLATVSNIYKEGTPEYNKAADRVHIMEENLKDAEAQSQIPSQKNEIQNSTYESLVSQVAVAKGKYESLKAQKSELEQQLVGYKDKVQKLPSAEKQITKIERERAISDLKYKNLIAAKEVIVNRVNAGRLPAVIVQKPDMKFVEEPVEPNVPRTIVIGLLAGLALGAIFTVARESVKPMVFSATQLEQATGLPVVATIPRLPGGEVQRLRTLINSTRFPRKNFHDMASVALAERETLPKTVVVCGVDTEASSSMAAVSYAAALARAGLRVTLVDANPAKVLTRAFDMESENGIVDYLTQAALISQKALAQFSMLTKHNELLGCKICAYGTADTQTLTDFSDDRVAGIIEALKPDSDVLIIETAPSGRLPDAVRMARHADEVLATFEAGTSSDRSVDTLRDLFADAGVKKMSMVLTSTLERIA